jgi:hypothetical protein
MALAKTVAYYATVTITAIKCFTVQGPRVDMGSMEKNTSLLHHSFIFLGKKIYITDPRDVFPTLHFLHNA